MSGDFDWRKENIGQEEVPAAETPETTPAQTSSRPRATTPTVRRSIWTGPEHGDSKRFADHRGYPFGVLLRRHLVLLIFLGMLAFPVGAVILGYVNRPASGTPEQAAESLSETSSDSATSQKIPKPAPGKPFPPKAETPPPNVERSAAVPALPMQPPTGMAQVPQRPLTSSANPLNPAPNPAAPPPAPAGAAKSGYTPVVYQARHDKHFGESCSGQLTLDSGGLQFKCPDDPSGSVQVSLNDIQSVDGNGVRLVSGKKYHFSIAGMAKSSEEQLFANWLGQVKNSF